MPKGKNNVYLVWRTKRTPFYTESSNKGVFRFLVSVSLNRTMPSNVCFWCGTPNAQTMFSLSVFEVRSPKSFVFLVLCAERAFLCTKNANKGVFGYLVLVCLKWAEGDKCLDSLRSFTLLSLPPPQGPINRSIPLLMCCAGLHLCGQCAPPWRQVPCPLPHQVSSPGSQ